MRIMMDGLFKVNISSPTLSKDPYQAQRWARYFNLSTRDLIASYSFYLLEVLKKRVAHSVETQTIDGESMRSVFQQLNPHYKKKNKANKDKFWYDTEFLISSMRVWQDDSNRINLGIPKHIKHPTSKTPAYLIFKYLEFGTKTKTGDTAIPPRPIISPHLRFMLKNTESYFLYFIQLCINGTIKLKSTRTITNQSLQSLDIVETDK